MQEWLNLWLNYKKTMRSLANKDLVKAAHVIHMLHHMIRGASVNKAPMTSITSVVQGHGHAVMMHRLTKDQLVMTHKIWILAHMI